MAGLIGLAACSSGDGNTARHDAINVPAEVKRMIATEFPADGQVYDQSNGRFSVKPETMFCEMDATVAPEIKALGFPGMGIDGIILSEAIRSLGQVSGNRQQTIRGGHCPNNEANIVYWGYAKLNRDGQLYKLMLAVWQGDPAKGGATWVGGVERLDGLRPDVVTGSFEPMITQDELLKRRYAQSISSDIKDLSSKFSILIAATVIIGPN